MNDFNIEKELNKLYDELYPKWAADPNTSFFCGSALSDELFIIAARIDKLEEKDGEASPALTRFVIFDNLTDTRWEIYQLGFRAEFVFGYPSFNENILPTIIGKFGDMLIFNPVPQQKNMPESIYPHAVKKIGSAIYVCASDFSKKANFTHIPALMKFSPRRKWEAIENPYTKYCENMACPLEDFGSLSTEKIVEITTSSIYFNGIDGLSESEIYISSHQASHEVKPKILFWNTEGFEELPVNADTLGFVFAERKDKIWVAGSLLDESSDNIYGIFVGNKNIGFHHFHSIPQHYKGFYNGGVLKIIKFKGVLLCLVSYITENVMENAQAPNIIYCFDEEEEKFKIFMENFKFEKIMDINTSENYLWVLESKRLLRFDGENWEIFDDIPLYIPQG